MQTRISPVLTATSRMVGLARRALATVPGADRDPDAAPAPAPAADPGETRGWLRHLAAAGLVAALGLGVFGAMGAGVRAAETTEERPTAVVSVAPGVEQPAEFDRRGQGTSRNGDGTGRQALSERDASLETSAERIERERNAQAVRGRDEMLGTTSAEVQRNAEELESTRVHGMPLAHYTLSARWGAVGAWARYHTGVDLAAPLGSTISAPAAGTVIHAGSGGGAGSWAGCYAVIRHLDGRQSLYAHMNCSMAVAVGQQVTAGTRLGEVGMTGRSFGPHLHLELYPADVAYGDIYSTVDPMPWLTNAG